MQSSGELRRENAEACLSFVIARSRWVRPVGRPDDRLRDEAIQSARMTLDRFAYARNDGGRLFED